jgi:type VI secretion system secreted protein Hcp
MALFDAFLKIDGIDGESADAKHKGEIDVASWSWAEQQTGTHAAGGGGGAGKVSMSDVHFVMRTSKASPKLMLACASGEHIKKAVLTCRKAGGEQQEYLKVTFSDLLVSAYHGAGPNSDSETRISAGLAYGPHEKIQNFLSASPTGFAAQSPLHAGLVSTAADFAALEGEDDEEEDRPIVPLDHISLNFAKIEFEYKEQKPDGSLGGTVKAGWDVKANKKV